MEFPEYNEMYSIKYYCAVRLARKGLFTYDVRNYREVMLHEKPWDHVSTPMLHATDKFRITSNCFSGGNARLITKMDNNQIRKGDDLSVHVLLSSDANVAIKFAEVSTREHFVFSPSNKNEKRGSVYNRALKKILLDVTSDVKLDDSKETMHTMLEDQYIAKFQNIKAVPSFQGKFGRLTYEINVKLQSPQCVSEIHSFSFPFIVHDHLDIRDKKNDSMLAGAELENHHADTLSFKDLYPEVETVVEIPIDWQADIANPLTVLEQPSIVYNTNSIREEETTPEALVHTLGKVTADQAPAAIEKWLHRNGNVEQITPQAFNHIFGKVKNDFKRVDCAVILGKAMEGRLTCVHISFGASIFVDKNLQTTFLLTLAPFCIDPEQASEVFKSLHIKPFVFNCILATYSDKNIASNRSL